jgi:hypothetical protein
VNEIERSTNRAIKKLREIQPIKPGNLCIGGRAVGKEISWAIECAIQALEKQLNNGWIPISERLPEDGGFYNVTIKIPKEKMKVEFCYYDSSTQKFYLVADGREDENQSWKEEINSVLAWRSLPEPYKPDSEVQG